MKIDGFLKVPDIKGPSERDGHEDEIEIHGVVFSMEAPHDANTLARRGRVAMELFEVAKHYDMSSPYLKQALFQNKKLDEVVFTARRTIEEASSDYLVVTLTDASVDGYHVKTDEDEPDLLEERVQFSYKKIKFVYDDDHEAEMDVRVGV
jgi:type VI secretion system secreted protein Hcp